MATRSPPAGEAANGEPELTAALVADTALDTWVRDTLSAAGIVVGSSDTIVGVGLWMNAVSGEVRLDATVQSGAAETNHSSDTIAAFLGSVAVQP